jgi:hypothetical protein
MAAATRPEELRDSAPPHWACWFSSEESPLNGHDWTGGDVLQLAFTGIA